MYRTRFIKAVDGYELINLYHLARVALSGEPCGRWERMQWATREFHKIHPEVSETAARKDLDGLLN